MSTGGSAKRAGTEGAVGQSLLALHVVLVARGPVKPDDVAIEVPCGPWTAGEGGWWEMRHGVEGKDEAAVRRQTAEAETCGGQGSAGGSTTRRTRGLNQAIITIPNMMTTC